MNSGGGDGALTPEALSRLGEAITLVFSQWTALQMAIEERWGGRDSRNKSEELASMILSWFARTKGDDLYIDDLENMLDENMVQLFNAILEDGSVEEVARQLMIIHEDCLNGNFEAIEKLRKQRPERDAVCQSKRVIAYDEDESSDEEMSDMMIDEPTPKQMVGDQLKPKEMTGEEGWSVVARRNKGGKRSG